MARETFYHLKPDKKEKLEEVLRRLFQEKPFQEVTVKEIVEETGIARGSFYQYFDDLEDAYFTVLDAEITDVHTLFMKLLEHRTGDMEKALNDYGERLSEILFRKGDYLIYKNRYLYWNESLDRRWKKTYQDQTRIFSERKGDNQLDAEKMHYLKGVVHMLIKRNFQENWSKEAFKERFKQHVHWMMKGVGDDGNI